ncbi:MAG: type II toxin-antitoxin system PemK/MazF family toxin [Candidatus Woesearchaeota archaeon]
MEQIRINQGDVLVLPIPFTDLKSVKIRPVLVISNTAYNTSNDDVIVCSITSKLKNISTRVNIPKTAIVGANLDFESQVCVDNIHKISKSLIHKKVGSLKNIYFKKTMTSFSSLF